MSMWIETLTVLCEWGTVCIGTKDKESIEAKHPQGSCCIQRLEQHAF